MCACDDWPLSRAIDSQNLPPSLPCPSLWPFILMTATRHTPTNPPHHRCMKCYDELKGEEIEIGGTVLRKSELVKEKNDKVRPSRVFFLYLSPHARLPPCMCLSGGRRWLSIALTRRGFAPGPPGPTLPFARASWMPCVWMCLLVLRARRAAVGILTLQPSTPRTSSKWRSRGSGATRAGPGSTKSAPSTTPATTR